MKIVALMLSFALLAACTPVGLPLQVSDDQPGHGNTHLAATQPNGGSQASAR